MYKNITIELLDVDEYELSGMPYEFNTIKDALLFVKMLMDPKDGPDYLDRKAEIKGYHRQLYTIRLMTDGESRRECYYDWFPSYFVSSKPIAV